MEKKVSIIIPCYNAEKFIDRSLNSVLNQTYSNIELIVVDDGSTDNSEKLIHSFENRFENKGYSLKYIYQTNEGQASAANTGLKLITGVYFSWIDIDDILNADAISKKVLYLENNLDCGLVSSNLNIVYEEDINEIRSTILDGKKKFCKKNIFEDVILEKYIPTPISYMVKMTCFDEVVKDREIFISREGQNWQLLLPLAYKYKCGYIDECLASYVIRKDSHSHSDNSFTRNIERTFGHAEILNETLNRLSISLAEKNKYQKIISEKYLRKRFFLACFYKEKAFTKKYYLEMRAANVKKYFWYGLIRYSFFFFILRVIKFIQRIIKG